MAEAYDNSFLPDCDPAVLDFARYCIVQQILQSPDGFSKAEELARDPEEYVRLRCMALFAQLKDEYSSRDGQAAGLPGEGDSADFPRDSFDLSEFDGDLSDGCFRKADPASLRLSDGDVRRLAQELRRELPSVIAMKRAGVQSLPGPRPQRIRAGRPPARAPEPAAGRLAAERQARHSLRWREDFSKF